MRAQRAGLNPSVETICVGTPSVLEQLVTSQSLFPFVGSAKSRPPDRHLLPHPPRSGRFPCPNDACVSESEEFNRILVEAMAFGKPVRATDLRGGSIVIAHGETGLLVRPRDVISLTDALWLLRNEETRMRLGNNGYRYVLDGCVATSVHP